MIELKNVKIQYIKKFFSIFDLSVDIDDNTIFVGEQLSGGYALMRALAGIDKHFKGEILVDGKSIKRIKAKELDVAFVSSIPYVFKSKTAKENVAYSLKIRKTKRQEIDEKVGNLLSQFNINFADEKCKNLSPSEVKITCLLRAVVREPKLILIEHFFEDLDENYFPLANQIISYAAQKSLVVATENLIEPCYENFKIHHLDMGSLID